LKRPKEKVVQKTEEKSPNSTALRTMPISSSLGWLEDARNPIMVVIGQARLSTPSSKVDQAHTVPIVEARQRRNSRIPQATARIHPIENGPQTSHAPIVVTTVPRSALVEAVRVGTGSVPKRRVRLGAV
jgi:hypothetical protein